MKTYVALHNNSFDIAEFANLNNLKTNFPYVVKIFTSELKEDEVFGLCEKIYAHFENAKIIGSSVNGVIFKGVQHDDRTLIIFEEYEKSNATIRAFKVGSKDAYELALEIADFAFRNRSKMLHVLAHSNTKNIHDIVENLNDLISEVILVGGIAGESTGEVGASFCFDGYGVRDFVVLSLSGNALQCHNFINIAHEPISEPFTITSVSKNGVVETIDDTPAVEWFNEHLGVMNFNEYEDWKIIADNDEMIRFPIFMKNYSNASRFLRYDQKLGGLVHYFNRTPKETVYQIAYTNPTSVVKRSFEICKEIGNTPSESLFLYTCLFRKFYLNNCSSWEIKPYGNKIYGVFLMGEIGNIKGTNAFLEGSFVLVSTAENNVRPIVNMDVFEDLNLIEDETKELLNYVLMKQKTNLSENNKKLLEELALSQEKSLSNLYFDHKVGIMNYIKYKEDKNQHDFNKICLVKVENFDTMLSVLSEPVYYGAIKQMLATIDEFLKSIHCEEIIKVYSLNDDKIFLVCDDEVSDEEFKYICKRLFKQIQFIKFENNDTSNENVNIIVSRFVLVLNSQNLVESALNILVAISNIQESFYVSENIIEDNQALNDEFKILAVIDRALKNNLVVPFFQGIHDNRTGEIYKYESLMRIIDVDGTIYYPSHFLEVSKKYHLYVELGRMMIKKVFELFRHRKEIVSLNMSAHDVNSQTMQQLIFEMLRSVKDGSNFAIEILEDEHFKEISKLREFLDEVRSYGMKIAIDDFGTGYSNFVELFDIRPEILKIDGSIVKGSIESETSASLLDIIIYMARKFDMKLIAEFVENEEIQKVVLEKGVDFSQGYYFSKPCRFEELGLSE